MEDNGYELWDASTGNLLTWSRNRDEILSLAATMMISYGHPHYLLDGVDIDPVDDLVDLLFREGYLSEAQKMELLL